MEILKTMLRKIKKVLNNKYVILPLYLVIGFYLLFDWFRFTGKPLSSFNLTSDDDSVSFLRAYGFVSYLFLSFFETFFGSVYLYFEDKAEEGKEKGEYRQ